MKKLLDFKSFHKFPLLFVVIFLIWASIGTKNVSLTNWDTINLKVFINNIRYSLPLLLFIILFFFKKSFKISFVFQLIIFLIFFSFILGTINLYINNSNFLISLNNDQQLIKNGYLPNLERDILMSVYFILSYLIFSRFNLTETKILLKYNFILLIFVSFVTLFFAYIEYFNNKTEYLYFTQFLITGELFNVPTIRSLGLSRNLLIILIPLTYFYFFKTHNKYKFLISILIVFLCLNIFQLQSRLTFYSFIIFFSIILIILFYLKKFKKIISLIILFLLIPFVLNLTIPYAKKYYNGEEKITFFLESRIFTTTPNNFNYKKKYKDNIVMLASEYSSGRLNLWIKTISLFNKNNDFKNNYLGFGTSSDRFFLKENVSNAILYSLISGGFLGLFCLILFYIYILNLVYFYIKKINLYSNDLIIYSSITIILFIMLRSLVENSFLVFGTDNIILFICLTYLNQNRLI